MLILKNLNNNKDLLNKINVFPIADGDTGRNLCTTLEGLKNINFVSLEQYISEASERILMAARGSSGNILALYILGLKQCFNEDLSAMCKQAAEFAWSMMYEPVEGTILTAMKAVPESYTTPADFIKQYINSVYSCLFSGPDLLPVLKENNTLDSGTLGFLYILCDIYETLTGVNLSPDLDLATPYITNNYAGEQYCTEILLNSSDMAVKSILSNFGSELIVLSLENKIKLHIHTNDYKSVINICKQYGTILELKVEDMFNNNLPINCFID